MTTMLSIQSHVAYGHAGNSAALFPLQRSGVEVFDVLTVTFSNHTGYGSWRGPHVPASDVWDVVQGIDERGALAGVDALLTGYLGTAAIGEVLQRTAELVKQRHPGAVYCCDPVMGDTGPGFYTEPGIPEFIRDRLVPLADVMTPNQFELEFLTGRELHTLGDVLDAARALQAMGPATVLVTSVVVDDVDPGDLHMVAVDADGAWRVGTPNLHQFFTGSGDVTAAMFLTHLLRSGSAREALEQTASIVFSLLERTHQLGRSELALVAAQDVFVDPPHHFSAHRIR